MVWGRPYDDRQESAVAEGQELKRPPRRGFKGHVRRGRKHVPPMRDLPIPITLREFRKVALADFPWLLTMLHAAQKQTGERKRRKKFTPATATVMTNP